MYLRISVPRGWDLESFGSTHGWMEYETELEENRGATEGSYSLPKRPLSQAGSAHCHDHTPAKPPASPAVGEFSLSTAFASLPVSSDPFWMSPAGPSASVQKPHTCWQKC